MINLRLDNQTARFLLQLLEKQQNALAMPLVAVLRKRLEPEFGFEQPMTVVERMGGMPKHLLNVGRLSDRDERRQILSEQIRAGSQYREFS